MLLLSYFAANHRNVFRVMSMKRSLEDDDGGAALVVAMNPWLMVSAFDGPQSNNHINLSIYIYICTLICVYIYIYTYIYIYIYRYMIYTLEIRDNTIYPLVLSLLHLEMFRFS